MPELNGVRGHQHRERRRENAREHGRGRQEVAPRHSIRHDPGGQPEQQDRRELTDAD